MNRWSLSILILASLIAPSFMIADGSSGINEENGIYSGTTVSTGYFTENLGQWDEGMAFIGNIPGGHLALSPGSAYIDLQDIRYDEEGQGEVTGGHVIAYRFLCSSKVMPLGSHQMAHLNNYFIGRDMDRWASGARNFQEITYPSLWENIDLSYFITSNGPKYEFLLSPGADPDEIRIRLEGINELEIDNNELIIRVADPNVIRDTGLVAYYADDRTMIDVSFNMFGVDSYGFELGRYDDSRPVVIDPYLRSTFLGGSGGERGKALFIDDVGSIFVTGTTTASNFPTTPGAYDSTYNGGSSGDCFVTKINSTLTSLDYSTYLGGTGTDGPADITVENGEAIVTGTTYSLDFPITANAYNDTAMGWYTIFLTRLNRSGGSLEFSTYIDGGENESASALGLDDSGNIVVFGSTSSPDFPTTQGAFDRALGGTSGFDTVLFKMDPNGTRLLSSTFLGGTLNDGARDLQVDPEGRPVVLGYTISTDFNVTSGSYSTSQSGNGDLFISRFDRNFSKLENSTYFGGSALDMGQRIQLDRNGDVIVCGYTHGSIPTTSGAYDTTANGNVESFISRFDRNLSMLKASTYIGGSQDEREPKISVDDEGNIFIFGNTASTNFPTTTGADDATFNGTNNLNLYLAKLDGNLSTLMYSTYLGGDGFDYAEDLAIENPYKVVLTGLTSSTDFKTAPVGYDLVQDQAGTQADAFVVELSLLAPPTPPRTLNFTRGDDWVHLTWESPLSDGGLPVIRYEVWRGERIGSETLLAEVSPGELEHNDTTIKVDDEFFYYSLAVNDIGPSLRSNRIRIGDDLPPWLGLDLTPVSAVSATELTFATEVFDNAFVDSVHVEFWWEGVTPINMTMSKEVDGTFSYTIPLMDEIYSISYRFSLNDTSDNWFRGPISEVSIGGTILPQFGVDRTPSSIKAGDRIRFSVEAWDNFLLKKVTVEFWSEEIYRQNVSMQSTDQNIFEYELKTERYSLAPVEYQFHAVDLSGHWNSTEQNGVTVLDAELPMIAYDTTPQEATTGDMFTFSVSISDNQEISSAWVEFSINDMEFNRTLERTYGNIYTHEVEMPDEVGRLSYRFLAMDDNDNLAWVPIRHVLVTDNDKPTIDDDLTNDTAYCGDMHKFMVEASDNVAIGEVLLEYWFGEGEHRTLQMEEGEEQFMAELAVPASSKEDLVYLIRVADTSGNSVESDPVKITVKDGIGPYLVTDLTPGKAYTGGEVAFEVKASDNVGIKRISSIWKSRIDPETELFLEMSNGAFKGSIEIPFDSLEDITYHLVIVDPSGNQFRTDDRTITVEDSLSPVIEQVQDLDVGPNTELNIEISAEDNIGVTSLSIENSPLELQGNWIKGRIEEPGSYNVMVKAADEAGNTAEMAFVITITGDIGGSEEDEEGDPVWICIPPVLGMLLLTGAFLFFLLAGREKKDISKPLSLETDGVPIKPTPEQRGDDELERLFQASYMNGK